MLHTLHNNDWQIFDVCKLMKLVEGDQSRIYEFLKTSSLSISVYQLPCGCRDMQAPHQEDEVYIVLEGKAVLAMDGVEYQVKSGSILFVPAKTVHSFFDIQENLTVLAIFGPHVATIA